MSKKLSQKELERFIDDQRHNNEWRTDSRKAVAYYDGKQLDSETLLAMEEKGLPPLIRNLVRPTVDLVLGTEAKSKRDWRVVSDTEEDVKVAEALSVKLKQAERTSDADRAMSDMYASGVKAGIGWTEVAREADPFLPPYRIKEIHRDEIYYDWRAREPDLSDARYLIRKQWLDRDSVIAYFPKKERVIKTLASHDRAEWDLLAMDTSADPELFKAFNELNTSSLDEHEWYDSERERLRLYEVWYKVWVAGLVMTMPSGKVVEYDQDNLRHQLLVSENRVQLKPFRYLKPRLAWWCGPIQLVDIASPYPHRYFPYVPFIAAREDGYGMPYGLVRHMISPQDEINARLSRMMWGLSAKRLVMDSDALDMPVADAMKMAAQPNAFFLLNPNRKNKNSDAFRVETDFELNAQQFQVLQSAEKALQDAAGVYQAQLGKDVSGEASGIAISSLVEQGSITLAEINDNYRYARKRVGELLLTLIIEDMGDQQTDVVVDRQGSRKTITLNKVETDQSSGIGYMTNAVTHARTRMELDDIPNTSSYRQQQFTMMAEFAKSLPPDVMPLIADFMVEVSEFPHREELIQRLRKQFNIAADPDEMTPEEQQFAQQEQAKQERMEEAEISKLELDNQKTQASIAELQAKIDKIIAETEKTEVETELAEDSHLTSMDEKQANIHKTLSDAEATQKNATAKPEAKK